MATMEELIKAFSENLSAVQKLKKEMDEIQSEISPDIKNVHSKSQALLGEIGRVAEEYFKQMSVREAEFDQKVKDALAQIEQAKQERSTNTAAPQPVQKNDSSVKASYKVVGAKVEIKFDGIPSVEIRNQLKEHKFGWSKNNGVWVGNADKHPENVALAKKLAGQ